MLIQAEGKKVRDFLGDGLFPKSIKALVQLLAPACPTPPMMRHTLWHFCNPLTWSE